MVELEKVQLEVDELEAVRWCDVEGVTQAEAGEAMGVSRGTIQRLVASARKKITAAILQGQALVIELEDEGRT